MMISRNDAIIVPFHRVGVELSSPISTNTDFLPQTLECGKHNSATKSPRLLAKYSLNAWNYSAIIWALWSASKNYFVMTM
jgi:hypothetical protein